MPKIVRVRAMTEEEQKTIEQLSRSRTAAARQVERARMIHKTGARPYSSFQIVDASPLENADNQMIRIDMRRYLPGSFFFSKEGRLIRYPLPVHCLISRESEKDNFMGSVVLVNNGIISHSSATMTPNRSLLACSFHRYPGGPFTPEKPKKIF